MPLLHNLLIAIASTAAQADVRGFLQVHNATSAVAAQDQAQAKMFERVWMVCEVPKAQPRTAGEIAAGMTTTEPAKCTEELSYKDLCCAGFEKEKFTRSGFLGLDSTKYLTTAPTQAGKVIKVCTQASNGMALMAQAKSDAATMPVQCTKMDITEAQLRGNSDGLKPGEIVLRERLLFFANQGISMKSVPTCKEAYPNQQTCAGGKTPTFVSEAWLAQKKFNLLSLKESVAANIINVAEGDAGSDASRFGFGGMMTSGSFMMMSSGF